MNEPARRHALFLQGMPSPFFKRIGEALVGQGWRVTRINLSPGDWLFWHGEHALSYRGSQVRWPRFIEAYMQREQVTDLLLLGENRRYHREAVDIALRLGLKVTVTDFGYLRPDWITFERNGMTGGSLFPRDPAAIRALAERCEVLDWQARFVDSPWQMVRGDLLYNFANLLFIMAYPFYRRSDLRPPTPVYTLASARRLLGNRLLRRSMWAEVESLVRSGRPFYLFPMQLDFDYQIVAYSPFRGVDEAITMVMQSFALHAPADSLLVLKEHPWDPAIRDCQHFARKQARAMGLQDRVLYLRGGCLDRLVLHAQGVVLVNSTTGMRALQLRRPLKVLGEAVFDVPGLTHQGELDAFWSELPKPDSALVAAFISALAATVQIRGVFFKEPGLSNAVLGACHRLVTDTVGKLKVSGGADDA